MMVAPLTLPERFDRGHMFYLHLFEGEKRLSQTHFLYAHDDLEATSQARSMMPWLTREVWEGRRLVRVLGPTC